MLNDVFMWNNMFIRKDDFMWFDMFDNMLSTKGISHRMMF